MSWLSDLTKTVTGGETSAQKRQRRAQEAEMARLAAIGPSAQLEEIGLESLNESDDEKRRRMRLAQILQQGGDPYGKLTLGKAGLVGR